MSILSKNSVSVVTTILSIASALITIIQLCLNVRWYYYVCTIGSLLLVWIIIFVVLLSRRPWYKRMSNPLIRRYRNSPYSYRSFFSAVFKKPFFESPFSSPKYSYTMNKKILMPLNTSRFTVVIEDDPVGYAAKVGMLPCVPVEDDISNNELYDKLLKHDEEIRRHNMFFIATPSRRLEHSKSLILNREIGYALRNYFNEKTEKDVRIISKIDSCLRSNYEAEYDGITEGLGKRDCIEILIPSYVEQGRVTMHGCQYIKTNDEFKLLAESEYSSFKGLEYTNSDLALWLEKKSEHINDRKRIGLIDIDILRTKSPDDIALKIISGSEEGVKAFVFDSVEEQDLIVASAVIRILEDSGKTLYLKLGPSMINMFAQEYAIPKEEPQLSSINSSDNGIFIVGSLTSITKKQIEDYDDTPNTSIVTVRESDLEKIQDVDRIIEIRSNSIIKKNKDGDDVILTTEYWKTDQNEYPDIQKRDIVLSILAKICQQIRHSEKRWFLLKGSDTALYTMIHGLDIDFFYYCGQYIPGVIHCKCYFRGRLKSFFIVGGNVGSPELLARLRKNINFAADT